MIKIDIDTRTFNLPESWEECSHKQQLMLASVALVPIAEVARPQKEFALVILLDCTPEYWAALTLTPNDAYHLMLKTQWVWNTKPITLAQNYVTITKGPLSKGTKYYLPDSKLEKISCLDLAWLMVGLVSLGQASNEAQTNAAVDELLGIAARPLRKPADLLQCQSNPLWNGDRRQPVSQHHCDHNTKQLANLNPAAKRLIVLYVIGLIERFRDEFSILFEPDTSTIQPKFPEGFGLEAHLRRVAKDGRFGNYDKVCYTNARTIWLNEVQLLLEYEAELANIEKQNKAA